MNEEAGIDDFVEEIRDAHVVETSDTAPIAGPAGDTVGDTVSSGGDSVSDAPSDSAGDRFDPSIHAVDEHGQPKRTKTGKFRKMHRSKRPQTAGGPKLNIPGHGEVELNDTSAAAEIAATFYIQTGVILFGPEWLPNPQQCEREFLVSAFKDFLDDKNITDFPPGIALTIACLGYAAPRFYKPETKSRLSYAFSAAKEKIAILYVRARYGARNDFGTKRMRKNDSGKTADSVGEKIRRAVSGSRSEPSTVGG